MNYRHLGRAGVKISEIALGSWLTYGAVVEEKTAIACHERAYDLGINLFDTANVYARGRAETVVGKALKQYPRDSYVLATKAFWPMGEGPNDRGLSRKHVFEQLHASLKRLGTDYVDIFWCHRYDPETPLEETLRTLDDFVTQGKVLYLGVSMWTAAQIVEALRTQERLNLDRLVADQPEYSMLDRTIEPEIMPMCEREGLGITPFSPLAQGVLTGKYKPGQKPPKGTRAADPSSNMFMGDLLSAENLAKVEKLKPIAKRNGLTLAQLALAWCLRKPVVSSVIIGASRPEQIDENVKAGGVALPPEDLERIEKILA